MVFLIKMYQQIEDEIETDNFVMSVIKAAVGFLTFLMWKNLISDSLFSVYKDFMMCCAYKYKSGFFI